jgi:hypothetical protein
VFRKRWQSYRINVKAFSPLLISGDYGFKRGIFYLKIVDFITKSNLL